VRFCERFVDKRSRTHDQMVQAARSSKQNILEGSRASGTSKETEIKLTNVACASLEERLGTARRGQTKQGDGSGDQTRDSTRKARPRSESSLGQIARQTGGVS
jgi:hypothetical protein